jgi:hypothetical protein
LSAHIAIRSMHFNTIEAGLDSVQSSLLVVTHESGNIRLCHDSILDFRLIICGGTFVILLRHIWYGARTPDHRDDIGVCDTSEVTPGGKIQYFVVLICDEKVFYVPDCPELTKDEPPFGMHGICDSFPC